ncbi:MAG: diguanylate cyclase [Lachnospiraceae bacterium]|nr:diguanylate cyclase [Lachnospiraceae bacterium]
MKLGNMTKKIIEFIYKDTRAKNESKKTIVVIRNILITTLIYFFITLILSNLAFGMHGILFYVTFFAVFIGIFAGSYYLNTNATLWLFNVGMLAFIIVALVLFGWNIGVQHFLMVLLLLYFFSGYQGYKEKFAYAAAMCVLRIVLFLIFLRREPYFSMDSSINSLQQIINTITIFCDLSLIAFIFGKDGQELEGKLVEYNKQLEEQANTDKLTGLFNRRKALEYLTKKCKENSSFCLCICDIDFFKKVNDTYGHDTGDEVLKGVANIFSEEMLETNMAARWGGEEFLLIFSDINGDEAYEKLERIRRRIKEMRIKKDETEIAITMTYGLTEYDFSGNIDANLQDADAKLYQGKETGRDKIVY